MMDDQSTSQCPASPNAIIKINERSDDRGVKEVDRGRILRMYREYS